MTKEEHSFFLDTAMSQCGSNSEWMMQNLYRGNILCFLLPQLNVLLMFVLLSDNEMEMYMTILTLTIVLSNDAACKLFLSIRLHSDS